MTKTLVVVGLGGGGYYVVPPLVRYLTNKHNLDESFEGLDIYLVDGDVIEDKNILRVYDSYDSGDTKVGAMLNMLERFIPEDSKCRVYGIPHYITPDKRELHPWAEVEDNLIIISCVDNNKSRLYLDSIVSEKRNSAIFAAGNELDTGDVLSHVRKDNEDVLPPLGKAYPELLMPSNENLFPGEKADCQVESIATPQLNLANFATAYGVIAAYYQFEQGVSAFDTGRVFFDLKAGPEMTKVFPVDVSAVESVGSITIQPKTETVSK